MDPHRKRASTLAMQMWSDAQAARATKNAGGGNEMRPNGIEAQRARAIAGSAKQQPAPPRAPAPTETAADANAIKQLRAELEERDRRIKTISAALVKTARARDLLRTALAAVMEELYGETWIEKLEEVANHGEHDADDAAGDRRDPA